jgi:hypothetical protein
MDSGPAREAPIEHSLDHYMEEQALACASAKAHTDQERAAIERLCRHRAVLMEKRAHFLDQVTAKRHACGEFYSDAKVASINAMGPTRAELDQRVRGCFESQPDVMSILKSHALSQFGYGLISQRSLLVHAPDDIVELVREKQALEEAFAAEWLDAIDDPSFRNQVRHAQRETMITLRTSSTGMFFVTEPACPSTDGVDAAELGRAWNKLDSFARELDVPELSAFIGIDGQSFPDGSSAEDILPTVEALLDALQDGKRKLPAKKSARESLRQIRNILFWLQSCNGRAYFAVDL